MTGKQNLQSLNTGGWHEYTGYETRNMDAIVSHKGSDNKSENYKKTLLYTIGMDDFFF